MFSAYDSNKNLIQIEDAKKGEKYYCPICEQEVIVKALDSLAVHAHFAHKKGAQCYDDWTHDMSEWHRQWQNCFPERFREVVMEKDGKKHRADIFTETTVIEFQHSPIKAEEIQARNDFYNGLGYPVVWVFDMKNKIDSKSGILDPVKCSDHDLFIKRAMAQFANIRPVENNSYFFQYDIPISNNNEAVETILLLVTKLGSKQFDYYKPIKNFVQENFIKEFARMNMPNESISDIIYATEVKKGNIVLKQTVPNKQVYHRQYTPSGKMTTKKIRLINKSRNVRF